VPKDDLSLPRFPPAALSPKDGALSPALKAQLELQASLLPPARWPLPAAVEFTRKQLTEQRQEITALERNLAARRQENAAIERNLAARRQEDAAIELEIAGRREAMRTVEEWLTRGRAASPPTQTPEPAADPSPTPEPEQDGPSIPGEEAEDGPQAALTRLFFQEVYGGRPSEKFGYRRLHERMKAWVTEKNKKDGRSRIAASETTIRTVRNKAL
jgi:hypothetical protein